MSAHINGPITGLYTFRCPCSYVMGVARFDAPPPPVDSGKWPHIHRSSWGVPHGPDALSRPVIMAIKEECAGPDSYRTPDGRLWDRRGF